MPWILTGVDKTVDLTKESNHAKCLKHDTFLWIISIEVITWPELTDKSRHRAAFKVRT